MDTAGIAVEADGDGFARVSFIGPQGRAVAGYAIKALLDAGGPDLIDVDTSGERKVYVVPESIAVAAGLLPDPDSAAPALPDGDPSEAWTVAQLRQYAAEHGVDLTGASVKVDILAKLAPAPADVPAVTPPDA